MIKLINSLWFKTTMAAMLAGALLLISGCGPWGKAKEDAPLSPAVAIGPDSSSETPIDAASEESEAPEAAATESDSLQQRLEQIRLAVDRFQTRNTATENTAAGGTGDAAGSASANQAVAAADASRALSAANAHIDAGDDASADGPAQFGTVSIVDIRPATSKPIATERRADGRPAPDTPPTLDALVRHYRQLAEDHPMDADVGRTLRVLQLMAGETAASLEPVAGLSAEDQRLWRGLVWAMANARDATEGSNRSYQAAQVLAVLDELRSDLQRQAPLELPTVQVCQRVGGFGVVTPLPSASVRPLDRVGLYTEVRNFASQRERDDVYHVRLNQFLVLRDAAGRQVWQKEYLNIDDRCHTQRQDFFLATTEIIPANLAPGRYVLEVTVEDVLARKQATATTELTIAAAR